MGLKRFDELTNLEIDTLREIGSIGTGNAATALSTVQQLEFINLVLQSMLRLEVKDFMELDELGKSTLVEVGNIIISAFINALSGLSGVSIDLTVPAFAVDMQGAILAVPMAEIGNMSDYLMTIGGNFLCDNKQVPCHLLLSPDIRSLNFLLKKLGVLE